MNSNLFTGVGLAAMPFWAMWGNPYGHVVLFGWLSGGILGAGVAQWWCKRTDA